MRKKPVSTERLLRLVPAEYHHQAAQIIKTLKHRDSVVLNKKNMTVSLRSHHCSIPLDQLLLMTFVTDTPAFQVDNEDIRQWFFMLVEFGLSHLITNSLLLENYKFFYIGP